MGRRLVSGVVGGLAGAIVFATMGSIMVDIAAGIGSVTLMGLIGHAARTGGLAATWMLVLALGALIGALFGALAGGRDIETIAGCGLACGVVLTILVGFVAVPLMLGVAPASPATQAWLPAALAGCLLFTSVLAIIVVRLTGPHAGPASRRTA